jgi:hypothetical protein
MPGDSQCDVLPNPEEVLGLMCNRIISLLIYLPSTDFLSKLQTQIFFFLNSLGDQTQGITRFTASEESRMLSGWITPHLEQTHSSVSLTRFILHSHSPSTSSPHAFHSSSSSTTQVSFRPLQHTYSFPHLSAGKLIRKISHLW